NVGDKLHTFTSPLGVLLPAAAYLLTGNTSDTAALWIFRVLCAGALGGAVVILFSLAQRHRLATLATVLIAAGLVTDAKTIDFTINGMETAFMLLFLACTFRAHLTTGPRQWLYLGAAWAGLMWTRPDSFIYVALIAVGIWLFNRESESGTRRPDLFWQFVRAGAVTTALYLPWLLWTWYYYGTPIPHTITAKGDMGGPHTLAGLLGTAVQLPYLAWTKGSSLELTFLPSYYMIGGWPPALIILSRILATLGSLLWILPFLRPWTRVASFAFFGAHLYLTYFPYFPFPWYIPSTTILALVALAGLVDWLLRDSSARSPRRIAAWCLVMTLLVTNLWSLSQVARQARAQQRVVEDGTRQKIGEWLRDHSSPGDTVFMEPLGYIGYFSGLKTYDWPGMSSQEMVHARQQVGASWGALLRYLQPRWIVLRPFEAVRVDQEAPDFLTNNYEVAEEFDHSAEVAALTVYGRRYLEHDAHFIVYRQRAISLDDAAALTLTQSGRQIPSHITSLAGVAYLTQFNGHRVAVLGPAAQFEFPLGADISELIGGLGVLDESWSGPTQCGPVDFTIDLIRSDGSVVSILRKALNPVVEPDDRGFRFFRLSLPQPSQGTLRFRTSAAQNNTGSIRAFWGELEVIPLRTTLDFAGTPVFPTAATRAEFGFANTEEDGRPCMFAHAPATLVYEWQSGMNRLTGEFGIMRKAYSEGSSTDGVVFLIETEDAAGQRHELLRRHLSPFSQASDRGAQTLDVSVPATPGGRIFLHTLPPPSGHLNNAWSYWRDLGIHP
ncbi:MAG: glycosyltransferase family 39 protein, partial [Candidatus Didemnitutus sp.]|nr:glycosyltransferase family 39 protein [Candidatus Didemnitutus sp.]